MEEGMKEKESGFEKGIIMLSTCASLSSFSRICMCLLPRGDELLFLHFILMEFLFHSVLSM